MVEPFSKRRKLAPSSFPLDMLPDELQNKVLFHLPVDDAVRYKTVRKDWKLGIESWASRTPMDFSPQPQKPFYIMFNSEVNCLGTYVFNSDKGRWVPFEGLNSDQEELVAPLDFPLIFGQTPLYTSASRGLVCLLDANRQDKMFVCNPILKNRIKMLPKAPGAVSDYCAITLSTDVRSRQYSIAMVRSSRVDAIKFINNLTIQLYSSDTCSWVNLHSENSVGWRGGDSCVICKGVLYSVAQFNYVCGGTHPYHAIMAYNLSKENQQQFLARTVVYVPCMLTCVRLLNLEEKLIMVGGIQEQGGIKLEGIGIWELCSNKWTEITRAPDILMRRMCKAVDDTFLCSGCGDLVFIQACTSRSILMYEFSSNRWKFLDKAPLSLMPDRSNYFSGFCFEPRLDIVP